MLYFEFSSKTGENLRESFEKFAEQLLIRYSHKNNNLLPINESQKISNQDK